jgi:Ca-activated chloride channel family protein
MSVFGDFHFLRPLWLLALVLLPLLWYSLRRGGSDDDAWRGAVDPHLLRHLIERDPGERRRAPNALLALGWILACVALAGPAWERLPQPLFENRAARVIVLELAPSMLAQDVKPSRVERARYKIADILERSADAQTALVAYAGDAFVVAPLTDDSNTVANFVDALEPSIMPVPGNDTGRAIDLAASLVAQAGLHSGDGIVIADAATADAGAAAAKARKSGVRVSVLGMGTEQGAPVATANGGFLKDDAGNIAMPRLDAAALRAVAEAGGGRYATYTSDARDLDALLQDVRPVDAEQAVAADAHTQRFLDRGPWLLLALLPLAALSFRRGWLMLLPLLLSLPARPARAITWDDLWSRPDQQAQAALDAGEAKRAQALARDPQLRGSAAYRAEDYVAAAEDFAGRANADAQYNLGNALAKAQKYREALAAYDRALKIAPDMDDAVANRKAVEDWLKQQKAKNDKNGKGKQGDRNEQRQSKSEDDQDSQSAQDQQQRADQQNGEGQQGDQGAQNRQTPDSKDGSQDQDGDQSAGESQGDRQDRSGRASADQDKGDPGKAGAQPESKSAEEQAQQQFSQNMDQALKNGEAKKRGEVRLGARADGKTHDERQQAVEQWLQRVPDDPGGLLRRKFQLESERRQAGGRGDRQ